MGFYIEGPTKGKAEYLVKQHNAQIVTREAALANRDTSKGIICVVDNGVFEAAGYIHNMKELRHWDYPGDIRPKTFLLMDNQAAKELSGYHE